MNELIKITERDGKQAVSARELHAFLESKQEFAAWIKNRIEKYDLVENQDYEVFDKLIKNPSGGRPLTEYALTIDAAKELSMVEGNERGKQARQYFIWCEKQKKELERKSQLDFSDPDTVLMLAQNWKEETQRRLAAEATIKANVPKVAYYDEVLSSKGYLTVNMIAAGLGISHVKLNRTLCDWGVQYKQSGVYFLFEKYRDGGYAKHLPHPYVDSSGETKTRQHMYWTEAGKKLIHDLWRSRL
ncbi:MAG: antA/AntB antirepressor family protein [Prevotellaceae bacterium]|nr:antA/AntB antirepressor family protein [Prevotellaceae bacterium]